MTFEEVLQYRCREPFHPFRIHLKDGRSFAITDPNLCLVAETICIVGIPDPDDPDDIYGDRSEWVWYAQMDHIELIGDPAAPAV